MGMPSSPGRLILFAILTVLRMTGVRSLLMMVDTVEILVIKFCFFGGEWSALTYSCWGASPLTFITCLSPLI
jgi:hypothetical protein